MIDDAFFQLMSATVFFIDVGWGYFLANISQNISLADK